MGDANAATDDVILEWVNHAGFIVRHGEFSLLSDPWIFGSVFSDGWDLLSPSVFTPEDFGTIKYCWFSHEHPDHFFPPVLTAVPEALRRQVVVLFQETNDGRVLAFCEKLGFQTRELPNRERVELEPGVFFTCIKNGVEDSLSFLEVGGKRILNLNDCVFLDRADVQSVPIGGDIDVLLSIFSYALKIGNEEDSELRRREAEKLLDIFKIEVDHFRPKVTIPFAAFKYFSNRDNFYLNDESISPQGAYDFVKDNCETKVHMLYPGEQWAVGTDRDDTHTLAKYAHDWEHKAPIHHNEKSTSLDDLAALAQDYVDNMNGTHNRLFLRTLSVMPRMMSLQPLHIRLKDLDTDVVLSMRDGLGVVPSIPEHRLNLTMNSAHLAFCLKNTYGFSSMINNGSFRTHNGGDRLLYNWAHLGLMTTAETPLNARYIASNLTKIAKNLGA